MIKMEQGKQAEWKKVRHAFNILTDKPKVQRPLGRSSRRWEADIRIGLKEIGVNTRNLIDSPQDRDYW